MPKLIDLTNRRFGRLLVVRYHDFCNGAVRWECVCDCGSVRLVAGQSLKRGGSKSCGCLMREQKATLRRTHGCTFTPEYGVWKDMRRRCRNKQYKQYKDYGGRGITVCERWESFAAFLEDLGPRPSAEHTIERVDNDGNYTPENCRWDTRLQQSRNRRCCRRPTKAE